MPSGAQPALVGLAVLLSRLPFFGHGYGTDPDAWFVVQSAMSISEGRWVSSRPPGYPLQEAVCALLWRGGPLAVNGVAVLASAVSAGLMTAVCVGRASPSCARPPARPC